MKGIGKSDFINSSGILVRTEWGTVSRMFEWAVEREYSIERLAYCLLCEQYGYEVMSELRRSEYADELFMLSGFEREFDLGKSKDDRYNYGDFVAGCAGYAYKYWYDMYDDDCKEIYRLANPVIIYQHFFTLHVSGYAYWVDYLRDVNGYVDPSQ